MMKILLILLMTALPVSAQTRDELRQKYESLSVGSYLIRPGIDMSVTFADSSLWKDYACQAIIKPERTTTSSADGSEVMSSDSVAQIIDEVAPVARRGKPINELSVNGGCNVLCVADRKISERRKTLQLHRGAGEQVG